ncbi:MAG: hypothetical protein JSS79_15810 [Bacteroidetes bacterium]|nr:hypothetical protein [Bacteroidota bacterium]
MNKLIFVILFCYSTTTFSQDFFSRRDITIKLKGLTDCFGNLRTWNIRGGDLIRIKFQGTAGDTSIYFLQWDEMGNGWAVQGTNSASTYFMKLKTWGSKVSISYNKEYFSLFPSEFPNEFELINTNDKIGVKKMGIGYFNYDKFSSTLTSKKYNEVMKDTLYQYTLDGVRGVTHAPVMTGFLYCKKYGFLKLDYRLENGADKECVGYKINSKFKKYLHSILN